MTAMGVGQSRAEKGQGAVRPAICTTGVPAVEMACRVELGTSVLEGSDVQENWVTDFGGVARGAAEMRLGRWMTSLAPLLAVGAAAAPL